MMREKAKQVKEAEEEQIEVEVDAEEEEEFIGKLRIIRRRG